MTLLSLLLFALALTALLWAATRKAPAPKKVRVKTRDEGVRHHVRARYDD